MRQFTIAVSAALLLLLMSSSIYAQDENNLMDLLNEETNDEDEVNFTYATFKSYRIINGRSVEQPAKGEMNFVIQHRFGKLNSGWREFFGLDQALIRIGMEYGIFDWWSVGFGRSTVEKTYDGFVKFKMLRQSSGAKKMPFTVSLFANVGANTLEKQPGQEDLKFVHRLWYSTQILIARKITKQFSLQITPTYIHDNLVRTRELPNDIFAIGIGGRYLVTKSMSINLEYFQLVQQAMLDEYENSLTISFDYETGGHVFQVFASNSRGMTERFFVGENTGTWWDGDIHIGFNVNRTFSLVDYEKRKKKKAAKAEQKALGN